MDKICKQENELEEVMEIFEKHGEILKNLFITWACRSIFP